MCCWIVYFYFLSLEAGVANMTQFPAPNDENIDICEKKYVHYWIIGLANHLPKN